VTTDPGAGPGPEEEEWMATHVEGTFKLTGWEEAPYEDLGGDSKLTRARIDQDFSGGIAASGSAQNLMFYRAGGTAAFVGLQRMTGQVDGHPGSFMLQSEGTFDGGEATTRWLVIPGSGTDELQGLRGEGTAVAPHGPDGSYTFDYDLG
jgi:Protein of unknown function (DUF3224)